MATDHDSAKEESEFGGLGTARENAVIERLQGRNEGGAPMTTSPASMPTRGPSVVGLPRGRYSAPSHPRKPAALEKKVLATAMAASALAPLAQPPAAAGW